MHEFDWHSFYRSDLQSVYALLVVPLAFLAYRLVASPNPSYAVVPTASRFVSLLTIVFAVETLLDPIATGPFLHTSGLEDSRAAQLIPFLFVYLGDFRVLLLVFGVAHPQRALSVRLARAAGAALIVPVWAGIVFGLTRWIAPDANGQFLWMYYEFGFLVLCIGLGRIWLVRDVGGVESAGDEDAAKTAFLASVLGYSAAYYALWLFADFLIVFGGLDLGWGLRVVPNQLYYAFWVPFVYWRFFSGRPSNAAR